MCQRRCERDARGRSRCDRLLCIIICSMYVFIAGCARAVQTLNWACMLLWCLHTRRKLCVFLACTYHLTV